MPSIRQAARQNRRADRLRRLAKAFHRIAAREDLLCEREARRWLGLVTSRVVGLMRQGRDLSPAELYDQASPFGDFRRWFRPRLIHLAVTGYQFEKSHLQEPRAQSFEGGILQRYTPEITTDLDLSIDMPTEQVEKLRDYLAVRGRTVWRNVSETQKKKLARTIRDGIKDGLTGPQLADRVQQVLPQYNDFQAKRLARTEVTAGMNNGDQLAREEAEVEAKAWVSTIDRRTRTYATGKFDHLTCNMQVVPNDKPFTVSGQKLMFPGDASLGAAAGCLINCRCAAVAEFDDTEIAPLTDPGRPLVIDEEPTVLPVPIESPAPRRKPTTTAPALPIAKAGRTRVASPVPKPIDAKDWTPPPMPPNPFTATMTADERLTAAMVYQQQAEQRAAATLVNVNRYRETAAKLEKETEAIRVALVRGRGTAEDIRALDAAFGALSDQVEEVKRQLAITPPDERGDLRKQYFAIQREIAALTARINKASQAGRAALQAAYKAPTVPLNIGGLTSTNATEAQDFLGSILGPKYQGHQVTAELTLSSRESATLGKIHIKPTTGTRTIVHEVGHTLEMAHKDVETAARGFLHSRGGFETPKGMGADYKASEVGIEDEFGRAINNARYVGKHYNGSTEVVSMGVEQLYYDPVGFARRDPEYFRFIVAVLLGAF